MYSIDRFEEYISIDELMNEYFDFRFTYSKCRECPGFAQTWSCPDFDFDPACFWRKFSRFHLIVDRVSNTDLKDADEAQQRLFAEKKRFDAQLLEIEKTIPGSYALAAQECVKCEKCARLSGHPCIHPEVMRYGPEAIGIIAVKLVEDKLGLSVQWSDGESVPDYYLLIGGVIEP
ncbi:MAG: DUF2284 domain-containing protein [Eubacteriaceae bacterium]|nr:DUF2284 domain-containing protein [Eubacteriaceae bacterium]